MYKADDFLLWTLIVALVVTRVGFFVPTAL